MNRYEKQMSEMTVEKLAQLNIVTSEEELDVNDYDEDFRPIYTMYTHHTSDGSAFDDIEDAIQHEIAWLLQEVDGDANIVAVNAPDMFVSGYTTISEDICLSNVVGKTTVAGGAKKCPHCGESYYMENFSTTTCMYFPPIWKDGVNINPDQNETTTHCTCMSCGKEFTI